MLTLNEQARRDTADDLVLAAYGARIAHQGVTLGSTLSGGLILEDGVTCWNPLTDDGQSRRLQVRLAVDLLLRIEYAEAVAPMCEPQKVYYNDLMAMGVDDIEAAKELAARWAVVAAATKVAALRLAKEERAKQ